MIEARRIDEFEALLDSGRHDLAESRAREMLRTDPDDPVLLCMLARAQLMLDQPELCLRTARAAMNGLPDSSAPVRLAAMALSALHRSREAEDVALAAVRLEPDLSGTHHVLAHVSVEHNPVLARAAAARAVELDPHDAEAHFLVGCAADALGDRRTAEHAYRTTLELRPDHAGAVTNLGRHDLIDGRSVRSLGRLGRAVSLDPQDEGMRSNVDVPVTHWLERGLFVVAVIAVAAVLSPAVLPVGAAVVLVGTTCWAVHVVRRLPRGGRRLLASYPRRHPWFVGAAVLTSLLLEAAAVGWWVSPPSAHALVPALCGLVVLTVGVGRTATFVREHR